MKTGYNINANKLLYCKYFHCNDRQIIVCITVLSFFETDYVC